MSCRVNSIETVCQHTVCWHAKLNTGPMRGNIDAVSQTTNNADFGVQAAYLLNQFAAEGLAALRGVTCADHCQIFLF